MADPKYTNHTANMGAIEADTEIRGSNSTEAGHTNSIIQHVYLDTGDGTNIQPVSGTVTVQDGSGTITVDAVHLDIRHLNGTDDTVVANLSATDNAVLDDIAANQTDGTQVATVTQGAAGASAWPVSVAGVSTAANQQPPATTSTIYNVTLTTANTEYSQALPANTRALRFRCRTLYDVRYAWVTGKVATPTAPYLTLPIGCDYRLDYVNLTTTTLYFASSTAGVIVELETWQ